MLGRLFGRKKEEAPPPPPLDLSDNISRLEGKLPDIDKKIAQCDAELRVLKEQILKAKTAAAKAPLNNKAMTILKRKAMYTKQRDGMQSRAFNLEQVRGGGADRE